MISVALLLCAAPLGPPDAPVRTEPQAYAIAAVEIELYHVGILAFSNLVTGVPFAAISWESISSHLDGRQSWTFDVDYYDTNQLAHPYQGALYFAAARSSGLSFAAAALFTFVGSLLWELVFEIDAPSINDQITTTLGGSFLGEFMYRWGLDVWGSDLPRFLAWPASFVIDPPGTFNRWLLGGPPGGSPTASWYGRVTAQLTLGDRLHESAQGTFTQAAQEPQLGVRLTYRDGGTAPFSWLDVDARLAPSSMPLASLFLRGLLVGRAFTTWGGRLTGVWGATGAYDFTSRPVELRTSIVGVGFGAALTWHFTKDAFVRGISTNELVPFGSIGSLGLDEDRHRDYHIGLGYSGAVSLELGHVDAGSVYGTFHQWLIAGTYSQVAGYELLTRFDVGLSVHLGGPVVAGAEWTFVWRQPYFTDATYDRALFGESGRIWLGAAIGASP